MKQVSLSRLKGYNVFQTVSPRLLFGLHVNNFKGCTRDQLQGTFTTSEEDHPVIGNYNWNWTWNQSHSQNLGQWCHITPRFWRRPPPLHVSWTQRSQLKIKLLLPSLEVTGLLTWRLMEWFLDIISAAAVWKCSSCFLNMPLMSSHWKPPSILAPRAGFPCPSCYTVGNNMNMNAQWARKNISNPIPPKSVCNNNQHTAFSEPD